MQTVLQRAIPMSDPLGMNRDPIPIRGTIAIVTDDGRAAIVDLESPTGAFRSATLTATTKGRNTLLQSRGTLEKGLRVVGTAIAGLEMWEMVSVQAE